MIEIEIDISGLELDEAAIVAETLDDLEAIAEMVGVETIAELRRLTDEMRPPIKAGGKWRRAHIGHWADRRGTLALSYSYEVVRGPDVVTVILRNTAEYAIYLELHDGYWVLSGATEDGGPAEVALRAAVSRVRPDWDFRPSSGGGGLA